MAIDGNLAIRPYVTNMDKWGIPEKNIKKSSPAELTGIYDYEYSF